MFLMINTNPNPGYPQLRVVSVAIATLAMITVATGAAGNATVLACAVTAIALATFVASFYLKP